MIRLPVLLFAAAGLCPALFVPDAARANGAEEKMTQDELVRRTQELFDAVVPGNQEPVEEVLCR